MNIRLALGIVFDEVSDLDGDAGVFSGSIGSR